MSGKRSIVNLDDSDEELKILDSGPLAATRPLKNPRPMPAPRVVPPSPHAPRPALGPMMAATSATTGFPPPSFQIGVSTHKRYADCFPDRTLAVIARLHCEEVQAVMHAYQTSQPLHLQYRYAIVLATATGSATDFTITTIGDTTPSRSYANVRLLDHFLTINHRIAALSERPKYVILKTKEGIKNPKYAHLHAVRYDEVGCGFDEDNCLSLYVTELMGGERHTRALYVERTEASVEEAEKDAEEVEKEFHGVEETVEAPSAEPLKVERGT